MLILLYLWGRTKGPRSRARLYSGVSLGVQILRERSQGAGILLLRQILSLNFCSQYCFCWEVMREHVDLALTLILYQLLPEIENRLPLSWHTSTALNPNDIIPY